MVSSETPDLISTGLKIRSYENCGLLFSFYVLILIYKDFIVTFRYQPDEAVIAYGSGPAMGYLMKPMPDPYKSGSPDWSNSVEVNEGRTYAVQAIGEESKKERERSNGVLRFKQAPAHLLIQNTDINIVYVTRKIHYVLL